MDSRHFEILPRLNTQHPKVNQSTIPHNRIRIDGNNRYYFNADYVVLVAY